MAYEAISALNRLWKDSPRSLAGIEMREWRFDIVPARAVFGLVMI
jgi:hypothetical protein